MGFSFVCEFILEAMHGTNYIKAMFTRASCLDFHFTTIPPNRGIKSIFSICQSRWSTDKVCASEKPKLDRKSKHSLSTHLHGMFLRALSGVV